MADSSYDTPSALQAAQAAQASAENIADALKVSELRFRRLFEAARDGILLLDSETGVITDANPFMAELLGYSHEEFLGKELWEIGLLQDKDANREAFELLKRDCYVRYENLPLETRNGERREVEFVSNLYRENGHAVIQCNIRDITSRKAVEKALAAAAVRNERIAATLQRSMLEGTPAGKFPGLDVETLYVPALNESDVGGDFYDAFAINDEKVALVVGDVSGKGLSAAGRTAEVKYALRAYLHAYRSPDIALTHLNEFICESHRHERVTNAAEAFIVLALVLLNAADGDAEFSSAGAEPTVILRLDGSADLISVPGMPLGIRPGEVYSLKTALVASGETVLMATDGITEARRGDSFLGAEGMGELAAKAGSNAPLVELGAAVLNGARDFAKGVLRDDVCLLLARRE